MNATHTPGPWCTGEQGGDYQQVTGCGFIIATVNSWWKVVESAQTKRLRMEADARLIAAAPDLLEALEKLVSDMHDTCGIHPQAGDQARAAIAKARGGN